MAIFDSWVLSFSLLILILADFSSFFWTKVPNKRYRTTFPLLFNMLILFRTCFSIFPHKFAKKKCGYTIFLEFLKSFVYVLSFFFIFAETCCKKKRATFFDPWLMLSAVYFGMFFSFIFPHKCCKNNAATPCTHQFLKIFDVVCCCPFIFAFLLRRVAKKTRLHFCGVKWQKLWGILCFRANREFFYHITRVCSGILSLTKMGHSKWGFSAHARCFVQNSKSRLGLFFSNERFWSF
jgi:hypothetical protein